MNTKDLIVAKFGGSSLASGKQFKKVKKIIEDNPNRRVVVPSAPGRRDEKDNKVTDLLYLCKQTADQKLPISEILELIKNRYDNIAKEIGVDIDFDQDFIEIKRNLIHGTSEAYAASRGEYLNGKLLAKYLGYEFVDAKDVIVISRSTGMTRWEETQANIDRIFADKDRVVVPGFYGSTIKGDIITFSRGGSDVTGSVLAGGLGAALYENWTDVSGFLMADPHIVSNPEIVHTITYNELRELSYMGASVIHEEAMFPAMKSKIPINIRNTNHPEDQGTMIVEDSPSLKRDQVITGVSGKKGFTIINIEKMLMNREKGFLRRLLSILETNDISVEHIPSGIDTVSLVMADSEIDTKREKVMAEIKNQIEPDFLSMHSDLAIIAIVGESMEYRVGISKKVFGALGDADINIRMISQGSSEISIFVGVENDSMEKGIRAIYEAFAKEEVPSC